ncbi:hypothetical protein FHS23_003285 [Prauserella isguenensis]|uniref:Uncharacterized protein n=1 Tax=Prauserella isguenensis TaxID=1470180 RepID=A0A839S3C8_9PSEU|nr:hypothetical protein [Prauserella isguenensis]
MHSRLRIPRITVFFGPITAGPFSSCGENGPATDNEGETGDVSPLNRDG